MPETITWSPYSDRFGGVVLTLLPREFRPGKRKKCRQVRHEDEASLVLSGEATALCNGDPQIADGVVWRGRKSSLDVFPEHRCSDDGCWLKNAREMKSICPTFVGLGWLWSVTVGYEICHKFGAVLFGVWFGEARCERMNAVFKPLEVADNLLQWRSGTFLLRNRLRY